MISTSKSCTGIRSHHVVFAPSLPRPLSLPMCCSQNKWTKLIYCKTDADILCTKKVYRYSVRKIERFFLSTHISRYALLQWNVFAIWVIDPLSQTPNGLPEMEEATQKSLISPKTRPRGSIIQKIWSKRLLITEHRKCFWVNSSWWMRQEIPLYIRCEFTGSGLVSPMEKWHNSNNPKTNVKSCTSSLIIRYAFNRADYGVLT